MTKFTTLPPLGSEIQLAGRRVRLPTAEQLQVEVRAESRPFWPWYRLCPIPHDVITVDTRSGEIFLVEETAPTATRDRWWCCGWNITSINDGMLSLGQRFQWTIVLPGGVGTATSDECAIDKVEIIGQAKQVYMMK